MIWLNNIIAVLLIFTFYSFIQIIESNDLPSFEYDKDELDSQYWNQLSKKAIRDALNRQPINKKAKNVILFIGDGMGISTITSARILKGQLEGKSGEESVLSFEKLPYVSLIKTYNVNFQVPDSAGTATAFLTGVKTNMAVLGVNARVVVDETNCDFIKNNSISSILQWAIKSGKSAGVVTTTRITDATPAASYSHVSNRYFEENLPSNMIGNCKDIARQLIEEEPGSQLKVIFGGGRRSFIPNTELDSTGQFGLREDNKNLIRDWINRKRRKTKNMSKKFKFIETKGMLKNINYDDIEYLLGLFNYTHMSYDKERDESDNGEPSLEEMTESAIKVLSKDPEGFVLLVESGKIDLAHHDNYAGMSLYETLAFEKAIQKAISMQPNNDTLIIVTADHSHPLTINGYPKRGNSIFGIAYNDSQSKPYTTLIYGNGPGFQSDRTDPSTVNTADLRYRYLSAVPQDIGDSKHSGEDVALYSMGPMAHLFGGTQEQTYIAHLIGFAACIGQYKNETHC